jgi:hypothetical protein
MKAFVFVGLALVVCPALFSQGVSATTKPPSRGSESSGSAQPHGPRKLIPGGCTLYLGSSGDWELPLTAALSAEKVPLAIVPNRSEADYEAVFPKEVSPKSTMIIMDARTGAVLLTESLRKRDARKAAQEFAKRLKAIVQ